MHSTLKQLSEILGISISTVSRALKDHPDISEKTKTKVKELADAMEYEPNAYAVQLRSGKSNALGILVPTINNFFYDSFIAAVEEGARQHGYLVVTMQTMDDVRIENANINLFRKNMVMGLFAAISIETDDMSAFEKLEELNIPVVFFDRVPETGIYNKVCLADVEAATIAAEAIIKKGKKSVLALFGHPHLSISRVRCAAFKEAFDKKAPGTKLTILHPEESERAYNNVLKAFSNKKTKPDVIFCMGDMILIGVMKAIHKLKLKVPADISVISISNGFIPGMYDPPVTYVETSGYKLGQLAFVQMLACLNDEPVEKEVKVESKLVKGRSL